MPRLTQQQSMVDIVHKQTAAGALYEEDKAMDKNWNEIKMSLTLQSAAVSDSYI